MPRIFRPLSFRYFMHLLPKQHYCFYRRIYYMNYSHKSDDVRRFRINFSTSSSPLEVFDNCITLLQEEFPEPKKIFYRVLNEALTMDETADLTPAISLEQISTSSKSEIVWKASITMKWPEYFQVEGISSKKSNALNNAFLYACQKLKHLGVLDNSNNPLIPNEDSSFKDSEVMGAKGDLSNLYKKFWHRTGDRGCFPKFKTEAKEGFLNTKYWKSELHVTYPEERIFEGAATRSRKAEGIASLKALKWLEESGVIDKKLRIMDYTQQDVVKLKQSHVAPYSICIPPTLLDKMQNVFKEIEELRALQSNEAPTKQKYSVIADDLAVRDAITDNVFRQLSDKELIDKNQMLYEKYEDLERKYSSELVKIKSGKIALPIWDKREEILKLIEENQVVILHGDTGCGKSTQVPQFILQHFMEQMKGAECNIIVTQPRRISAVSLSDRVAFEMGEKVGKTVGYQIRLQKCLPEGNGAILYCTTGMLLRKLRSNPNLEGISHIILDEVHERNIQIDFSLILLREILKNNKNIKLILMSASFNTELFAQYFDSSKLINIPGKMYPVEEIYLEDLSRHIPGIGCMEQTEVAVDPNLIVDVINYIDKKQPPGAILCFLPGWHDIVSVKSKLLESLGKSQRLLICPVHSRLPHDEQKKIFAKPSSRKRKVILATNIAETSITIDDVVYVVNSGLHKGTKLDVRAGIASLSTQWITKANVRQRKGRAGRVQPGICYHLFSRNTYDEMEDYPTAEILRIPLESIILDCKLYCPDAKAEEILSEALEPPATDSIQKGIEELQVLDVLDEKENLTDLGHIVVQFATHPRLSVSLVYAAFLRCLDPVLTLCAILTLEKEPFVNSLEDKLLVRKIKRDHDYGLCSDHLALVRLFNNWQLLNEESKIVEYVEKNFLDEQSLIRIKQLKELFAEDLHKARIISEPSSYLDSNSIVNACSSNECSVLAALTAAFFPNVIKIIQGHVSQGKINKSHLLYSIIKGQNAHIQKESVVSEMEELPSPWLVYFSALKSEVRRKALTSCVSSVPGICLLLLTGKDISMKHTADEETNQTNLALLSIDNYNKLKFSCTEREARLLLDCRESIRDAFDLYLQNLNCGGNSERVLLHQSKLVPLLREIFETPQAPFTKGQVYKFVDNELVSSDL